MVRAKVATHELGQVLLGAAAFRLLWVEPSAGESQPSTEPFAARMPSLLPIE